MGIEIVIVCVGAALNLALWGVLLHRLHDLPRSVWKIVLRNRVEDETRAMETLQAAAASRLGGLVIGVRTYHEQLAGLARAQVAEAEVRARVAERRASDVGVALDAASALVRDLRTLAEDFPILIDRRALHTGIAVGEASPGKEEREPPALASAPGLEERATVEMPRGAAAPETVRKPDRPVPASRPRPLTVPVEPADDERVSGDEELTTVQIHPLRVALTLASSASAGGAR